MSEPITDARLAEMQAQYNRIIDGPLNEAPPIAEAGER